MKVEKIGLTPLRIIKSEEEINELYKEHLDFDRPCPILTKYTGHGIYEQAVKENKNTISVTENLLMEKKQTYLHKYFKSSDRRHCTNFYFVKDIRLNVEKETLIFGDKPSLNWIEEYSFSLFVEFWSFYPKESRGEFGHYFFTEESRLLDYEEINQREWLSHKLSLLDLESDGLVPSIGQSEGGTNE